MVVYELNNSLYMPVVAVMNRRGPSTQPWGPLNYLWSEEVFFPIAEGGTQAQCSVCMLLFSSICNVPRTDLILCVCVCVRACVRACTCACACMWVHAQELQQRDVWALQTCLPHLQQMLVAFLRWPVHWAHNLLLEVLEGPGSPLALSSPCCGPRTSATLAAELGAQGRRWRCCICGVTSAIPRSSRNKRRLWSLPCIQFGSTAIHRTKELNADTSRML